MKSFWKNHAKGLRNLSLIAMILIPFLLYWAALKDIDWLVNTLLGLMGLSMFSAMKVG